MSLAAAALLLAAADPDALGAFIPDFARISSGGYAGLVAVGLGYAAWDDRLNFSLSYGHVPASIAGTTVHALTSAVSLRPFELGSAAFRMLPFYAGFGVLATSGQRYFLRLPGRYPDGYYRPSALHYTAHVGVECDTLLSARPFERHGLFAELVTLEVFARRYVRNPESVQLTEVVALALGYRVAF